MRGLARSEIVVPTKKYIRWNSIHSSEALATGGVLGFGEICPTGAKLERKQTLR
jgi:hypothetical protein